MFRSIKRLIYGKNPGNMSPTEKRKVVVETDLRWQDDGGPAVEVPKPIEQVAEKDFAKPGDVS